MCLDINIFFNIYIKLCFNNDLDRSKCSRTLWTFHSLLISMNLLAYHLVVLSIFEVKNLMLRITVNIKPGKKNPSFLGLITAYPVHFQRSTGLGPGLGSSLIALRSHEPQAQSLSWGYNLLPCQPMKKPGKKPPPPI